MSATNPPTDSLARIENLLDRLQAEDDVRRVIFLVERGGRYKYLIETPFKTFPRYVIGTTDFEFEDVRHLMKCFEEWGARDWWEKSERALTCARCDWTGNAAQLRYDPEDVEERSGHCPRCGGHTWRQPEGGR